MAVESHDKKLDDLLKMVEDGKAQLPDFQRSWVWDDTKICKLIESITSGFPMGAAMFLANGGEQVRFSYRKFEGVTSTEEVTPEWLVLDGQQRLTTLYQVLKVKALRLLVWKRNVIRPSNAITILTSRNVLTLILIVSMPSSLFPRRNS